jgi:hypothetical protein
MIAAINRYDTGCRRVRASLSLAVSSAWASAASRLSPSPRAMFAPGLTLSIVHRYVFPNL